MKVLNFKDFLEKYQVDFASSVDPYAHGSVYLAYDDLSNEFVVKIIETHPDFEKGIIAERYEFKGNHDNLLIPENFFLFRENFNKYVILMPFIKGGTVKDFNFSADFEKEEFISQILDAINYLHQNGIIWQNLSDRHILIQENYGNQLLKIINYGNSNKIPIEFFSDYTYLAPEQLNNNNVDTRTDIWALGVMIYWMFTGQYPFGSTEININNSTISSRILNNFTPGLYDEIKQPYRDIVIKCLKRSKNERWSNCGEIIDVINNIKSEKSEYVIKKEVLHKEWKKTKLFSWYQVLIFIIIALILGFLIADL